MDESGTKFQEYLTSRRYRMTRERQAILDAVSQFGGHFTADDFFLRLRQRHPKVSRATLYRTLDLLVQSGLVERVDLWGNRAFYEYLYGREHHGHLVCVGCGAILEFVEPEIRELQAKVCSSFDFEMKSHSHKIFGRCQQCRSGDLVSVKT